MTYAQIDDEILQHSKLLEVGEEATNLFIRGIIFCNGKLTDGRIPKVALRLLTEKRNAWKTAAALVRIGLWIDEGEAWQVHDFMDWNPSKDEVLRRRAKGKQRKKDWEERRAKWVADMRSERVPNAFPANQERRSEHVGNDAQNSEANTPTTPTPTPLKKKNPPTPHEPVGSNGQAGGYPPHPRGGRVGRRVVVPDDDGERQLTRAEASALQAKS